MPIAVRDPQPLRVGVLLGERPDLLQALLAVAQVDVVAVARDRAESEARPPAGLPRDLFAWWPDRGPEARVRREIETAAWFASRDVELVVAAGWLWILGSAFLDRFPGRVINVHPTLLPAFPGRHSVERAVASGARVHGVTVHHVDEGIDTGPILAQEALPIGDESDPREVRRRLAPLEGRVLAEAAQAIATARSA